MPWEEVATIAAPAADRPGAAFRDAHAALAFAGSGDHESMTKMTERLRKIAHDGDSFAQDIVLPLVKGIEVFGQGKYTESVSFLEPVFPWLVRIGGSHAQREVFEDTMLEAYIRAGQFDKAETLLRDRLRQRDSVRDTFWLGRVQSSRGQSGEALFSLRQASKAWEAADSSAPEIAALNGLVSSST